MNAPTTIVAQPTYLPNPKSLDEAMRVASILASSDLVPKDYKGRPENCLIAMQWGAEIGLPALQALQNIAVINGRPSIWGDAAKALVMASPLCEDIIERVEGDGDAMVAICIAKRAGKSPVESRFSVGDAKAAGLLGKQGPWTQYRRRMLQLRARGFALRDAFPDLLRGLVLAEEAQDIPVERDITPEPAAAPEPGETRTESVKNRLRSRKPAAAPEPGLTPEPKPVVIEGQAEEVAPTNALDLDGMLGAIGRCATENDLDTLMPSVLSIAKQAGDTEAHAAMVAAGRARKAQIADDIPF